MRTTSFLSVYNDIVTRHGLDPYGDAITHDTARAITAHMNDRIITVWQMWDWPELMLTEERAYRSPWNNVTQYRRVNSDGLPDEVYYIPTASYFQAGGSVNADPPIGQAPTNVNYWHALSPVLAYVDRDQPSMRPMGQVFGVYSSNPAVASTMDGSCCSSDICLPFRPSEKGVTICQGPATTVFIQYLLPVPQYTMVPFISGKNYSIGDRAFNTADGNTYRCIANTNTNTIGDPLFWSLEVMPAKFAHYLDEGTYSDTLIESFASGEDQVRLARQQLSSDRADASVYGMIDDLLEQGQKHHWLKRRWWGFRWHYDGMTQWPTSGYWCQTEPWSGNLVYTLQAPPATVVAGPSAPAAQPNLIYLPEITSLT